MSVRLQTTGSSNIIHEVKAQNRALKSAIVDIARNVHCQNGLKNVVSSLYPMDATRRFQKIDKYISKVNLSEERKYEIYAAAGLLEAFETYENKMELPQSPKELIPIIVLIVKKITTLFRYTLITEVIQPTNEIPYSIAFLPHKRLAVLSVKNSDFKRVNTECKETIPAVGVYVAEDPKNTYCRVYGLIDVIANDRAIDLVKREIGFFDKLQEQGQFRGIVETTDFNVIRDVRQEFPELHYVQPRGVTLRDCMHMKNIRKQFPKLFLDIAYGLQGMHRQNLAHLDVKIENIVLLNTTSVEAGLTNLGYTVPLEEKPQGRPLYGTLGYTPVDVFEKNYSLENMDLFAFGLVTYMALHTKPFPWKKDLESGLKIMLAEPQNPRWYDYMDRAKKSYKETLEEEEKLYTSRSRCLRVLNRGSAKRTPSNEEKFHTNNNFPHFQPLHRLSIDLLKKDTEITIDELVSRLEAMQISA